MSDVGVSAISLADFGAVLAALGALSTAAFGLLDVSKAFWGGVSLVGLSHIRDSLQRFTPALAAAVGPDEWWSTVRANWINGVPKPQQKAVVASLLKLGLSEETAPALAVGARVDAAALAAVAGRLERGEPLDDADLNLLGRMTAALDAVLDAAFERAEQAYRNVSRLLAGVIALLLAVLAWRLWDGPNQPSFWIACAVGLLAVPVAPVAKDLTSALSTAMRALKAAKAL